MEPEYYVEDGKLVEEITQEPLKRVYNRNELEDSLAKAREELVQKELEVVGKKQEIERLSSMVDCCDDFKI